MDRDVHQPCQPPSVHRRYAGYRLGIELAVMNNPKSAVSLRHEQTPIREKRQAPRM